VDTTTAAAAHDTSAAPARRGDPPALQENPVYSQASFRRAADRAATARASRETAPTTVQTLPAAEVRAPAAPPVPGTPLAPPPAEKLTDPDGYKRSLESVQNELRSLRSDIADLARALGQPPPSPAVLPAPPGSLQLRDPLSAPEQTKKYEVRQVQQGVTPQQIAADQAERITVQRLTQRQQELLHTLQRAEQRLQNSPAGVLPPGLRDQVIGEIMRAKYNVALFGGLGGAALSGWLTNAVA
jgi:hypothetical protein